jgi:hypothetical protein
MLQRSSNVIESVLITWQEDQSVDCNHDFFVRIANMINGSIRIKPVHFQLHI